MTDVKKMTVDPSDTMSEEDWLETTARIAGNIASGLVAYDPESGLYESGLHEQNVAETAVSLARAIVKALRGVEPGEPFDRASERRLDGQTGPS